MTNINERPILFSAPMVRAVLEGRKTVTRRPVKVSQIPTEDTSEPDTRWRWSAIGQRDARYGFSVFGATAAECAQELADYGRCPYGKPGERLWVRETLEVVAAWGVYYAASGPNSPEGYLDEKDMRGIKLLERYGDKHDVNLARQIPCIHMPRWACRILLEITDVRVERLQDISRSDIRAEGLQCPPGLASDDVTPNYRDWYPAAWRELWESTGGDWEANPWVWVIEFKRVNIDEQTG